MQAIILTLILLALISGCAWLLFGLVNEPPPPEPEPPQSPDALPPLHLHPLLQVAGGLALTALWLTILILGFSLSAPRI